MKKLLVAFVFSTLPLISYADISIGISIAPGVVVHIGDRDPQGHYWDGREWRDHDWWEEHGHGYLVNFGDYDDRGYRWDGDRWRNRRWWDENEARARAEEQNRRLEHERRYGHSYYSDEGRRGEDYRDEDHRDNDHWDRGHEHGYRDDHGHGDDHRDDRHE